MTITAPWASCSTPRRRRAKPTMSCCMCRPSAVVVVVLEQALERAQLAVERVGADVLPQREARAGAIGLDAVGRTGRVSRPAQPGRVVGGIGDVRDDLVHGALDVNVADDPHGGSVREEWCP